MTTSGCDLCGLPLRYGNHTETYHGRRLSFCCKGCRMVYGMLMEASDSPDPEQFKESELYRRCVSAGIVPATEAELAAKDQQSPEPTRQQTFDLDPETLPIQFLVSGMWCPACAWVIERALEKQAGIVHSNCDYTTDRLNCRYDPKITHPDAIKTAVRQLGYSLSRADESERRGTHRREFIRLMVCLLLSANVMMLSWSLYSGFFTALSDRDIQLISWPIVIFTTMVMGYGGGPLLRKSLWGLRAAAPGMETLVCLGAGSAYVYSLYNFMSGSLHLYFDTAAMLITLVLLGKRLESKAKRNVSKDLEGFLALQPKKVRLCSGTFPDGRFVDISQLAAGDHFRVKRDEVVPADGRIVSGSGVVDTSAVTGESQPKTVKAGSGMTSGTRLIDGDVTIETHRFGPDALLGQMIQIIESSLAGRTPLESRTDRWLAVFVPLAVGLSLGTVALAAWLGLTWEEALVRGLTVLVIACPCALGIAIPLARVAGLSRAGRQGILVRDFEAFERATTIDTIVMDKTGTLTSGNWALVDIRSIGDLSATDALALAAGLEQQVDHAVARAISASAREKNIPAEPVMRRRVEAAGVRGLWQGQEVRIGSAAVVCSGQAPADLQPPQSDGTSSVYLSIDGNASAAFHFGDALRPETGPAIAQLIHAGVKLHLISGDEHRTTEAVARQVGITNARGGLLPDEKAEYVARLQAGGAAMAIVGDGINDAPALAKADFSVALHRHAALTGQAAAITLMRSDPSQLLDFFRLAEAVNSKVAQNLGCAWIYNIISIPIAMSGWLNPLIAAVAMLLSSLTVIGNTLLLVRRQGSSGHSDH